MEILERGVVRYEHIAECYTGPVAWALMDTVLNFMICLKLGMY